MKKIFLLLMLSVSLSSFAQKQDTRAQILFETTMGNIRVVLYNETPLHRDNFIKMVKSGFYDGQLFHRVIRDFMIQSGDSQSKNAPKGKVLGESDNETLIPAEFALPACFHKRGALAMAREGDSKNPKRSSSSTQFYIVWGRVCSDESLKRAQLRLDEKTNNQAKIDSTMAEVYKTIGGTPHLDGQYTVFGEVVEGLDVVEKIQDVATDEKDRPLVDVKIIKATLIKNIEKK